MNHVVPEPGEEETFSPRVSAGRQRRLVVVLIGVSGSGKSTIGRQLSRAMRSRFYEGDDFHSLANRQKMRAGIPLTDADRWPWLSTIRRLISKILSGGKHGVVACSALRRSYRDYLRQPGVQFVYLKGDYALFRERLKNRRGHFFDPGLLANQFETLEEPRNAITVRVDRPPAAIVAEIRERLAPECQTDEAIAGGPKSVRRECSAATNEC
jgi:gluconokinase